ncbi:MAG: PilZ domain-containing protein [Pseudodesulfovibrio sp.]
MSKEQRRGTRVEADFEAYVTVGDVVMPVATRNLSLKGALLEGCDDCPEGTACELNIPLAPGVRIVVEGRVVRAGDGGVAMAFHEMDDLSFATLHRLVQLNASDPDVIDDELQHFPGI